MKPVPLALGHTGLVLDIRLDEGDAAAEDTAAGFEAIDEVATFDETTDETAFDVLVLNAGNRLEDTTAELDIAAGLELDIAAGLELDIADGLGLDIVAGVELDIACLELDTNWLGLGVGTAGAAELGLGVRISEIVERLIIKELELTTEECALDTPVWLAEDFPGTLKLVGTPAPALAIGAPTFELVGRLLTAVDAGSCELVGFVLAGTYSGGTAAPTAPGI